jgi:hypothetical protein
MAQTPRRIIEGAIMTGTAVMYYTVPANTSLIIKKLPIVNTTAGSVNCTIYLVPNGGSAGNSNTIASAHTLEAGETWSCPDAENMVMTAGGTISAFGNGLTIMGSGVEFTS